MYNTAKIQLQLSKVNFQEVYFSNHLQYTGVFISYKTHYYSYTYEPQKTMHLQ